jgi:ATP-dependent protease ClpP protease subunit
MTTPDLGTLECRANGQNAELLVYGPVFPVPMGSFDEATVKAKLDALKAQGVKNLTVRISSQGGSVWTGLAISNVIRGAGFQSTTAVVESQCVSITTMIALACDKVRMHEDSMWMIHMPSGGVQGTAAQLRKVADDMDKVQSVILGAYERKTGKPAATIEKWMAAETWFTAAEAKAAGFADEVIPADLVTSPKNAGQLLLNSYQNTPPKLRTQPVDEATARLEMRLLRMELHRLSRRESGPSTGEVQ